MNQPNNKHKAHLQHATYLLWFYLHDCQKKNITVTPQPLYHWKLNIYWECPQQKSWKTFICPVWWGTVQPEGMETELIRKSSRIYFLRILTIFLVRHWYTVNIYRCLKNWNHINVPYSLFFSPRSSLTFLLTHKISENATGQTF